MCGNCGSNSCAGCVPGGMGPRKIEHAKAADPKGMTSMYKPSVPASPENLRKFEHPTGGKP